MLLQRISRVKTEFLLYLLYLFTLCPVHVSAREQIRLLTNGSQNQK